MSRQIRAHLQVRAPPLGYPWEWALSRPTFIPLCGSSYYRNFPKSWRKSGSRAALFFRNSDRPDSLFPCYFSWFFLFCFNLRSRIANERFHEPYTSLNDLAEGQRRNEDAANPAYAGFDFAYIFHAHLLVMFGKRGEKTCSTLPWSNSISKEYYTSSRDMRSQSFSCPISFATQFIMKVSKMIGIRFNFHGKVTMIQSKLRNTISCTPT